MAAPGAFPVYRFQQHAGECHYAKGVLDVNAVFRPQRATPHFGWERTRIAAKRLKLWACSRIRSTPVSIVITRYDLHLKDLRLRQTSPSVGNLVSLRKPDVFFPG